MSGNQNSADFTGPRFTKLDPGFFVAGFSCPREGT